MNVTDLSQVRTTVPQKLNLRVPQPGQVTNPFARLSLDGLLNQNPFLPEKTAILGVCDDGLPVLLDFTDPKPGSILVSGTHLDGPRQVLQLALSSALLRTFSFDMDVLVVSQDPSVWQSTLRINGNHHLEVMPIYDRLSGAAILHLSRLLEQRMNGRSQVETSLLLIDDVHSVGQLDLDVQINLQWLIDQGPQYGIWSLGGMSANRMEEFDSFVSSFRTRILGQIDEPDRSARLANVRSMDTSKYHPTQQYCVQVNQNWMKFWLPGR
ncbi:MAG TPA: hypothetical protein VN452_03925 [Longilinea sp.]|nr:hypothetical protein [Longilinea sp.]